MKIFFTEAQCFLKDYYKGLGSHFPRIALFIVTTISLTLMMTSFGSEMVGPPIYHAEEVARTNVWSPQDFIVDATSNAKQSDSEEGGLTHSEKSEEKNIRHTPGKIRRGEIIVRLGEIVTPLQEQKLRRLHEIVGARHFFRTFIGQSLLTALVLLATYFFSTNFSVRFSPSNRDILLLSTTLLGSFFLMKVLSVLGHSLALSFPEFDYNICLLAAPLAAGGILLQVTLGAAGVFFFVTAFYLLSAIFLGNSSTLQLMILIGNVVGALSMKNCSRRSSFLVAGGRVALVNSLIVFCFLFLSPQQSDFNSFAKLVFAIIGGLTSGILAVGLTPIAEHIGSYVTDIKLLELASLDRSLLRDLSLEAPGTWNHSMVMGQLAEEAAKAIGASGLLARVGSYYHDIGKIKKPEYFVENQNGRDNPHDKLAPSMSALIIRTHVKEGVELARANHLPVRIIDIIPQHHGTALMEYFYEKALKETSEEEEVDETHYRYCGPKPQSKEAAIIMLADGVEAASRSLGTPTPAKIQGLVQKIINRVFSSGELDESELTLHDLHLIAKNFTRVLCGICHRRINYAEPVEKVRELRVIKSVEKGEKQPTEEVKKNGKQEGREANGTKQNGNRDSRQAASERSVQETSSSKTTSLGTRETLKRLGM